MLCGNQMCQPGRISTHSDVQGPANQQTFFSGRGDECVAHKLPFQGTSSKSSVDLPVFTHSCLYAGNFNCPMSTGVITPTARMETAYWLGQAPIILPFFTIPRMNLAFILGAGTLALARILPLPPSVLIVACLIDASWRGFLGHNIDLRL